MKVYQHVGPDFPGKCRAGQKEVSTQRLSPVPSAQAGPEAAVAPMRALLTRLKRVPCLHRLWTEWIEGLLLGNLHHFGRSSRQREACCCRWGCWEQPAAQWAAVWRLHGAKQRASCSQDAPRPAGPVAAASGDCGSSIRGALAPHGSLERQSMRASCAR